MNKIEFDIELWANPPGLRERACVFNMCRGLRQIALEPDKWLASIPEFALHGACDELLEDLDIALEVVKGVCENWWFPPEIFTVFTRLHTDLVKAFESDETMSDTDMFRSHPVWSEFRQRCSELLQAMAEWVQAVGLFLDPDKYWACQYDETR